MINIEKLGRVTQTGDQNLQDPTSLMQRVHAALDDLTFIRRPDFGVPDEPDAGLPVEPDLAELTRRWATQLFCEEFTRVAIFGDEDRFPQPDED